MYRVRTFIGPGMAGNQASVWIDSAPDHAPGAGDTHCVVTVPQPLCGSARAAVTCSSANGSIRFCGHGLLAAAAVLLPTGQSVDPGHPGEARVAAPRRLVLTTPDREVNARRHGQRLWLTLPRLRCSPCAIPEFARRCFNWPPMRAALAGDDSDYLVLEWPWATPLSALIVDGDRLGRHTLRAIIAVQEDRGPHYHYRLRYFAPQYGISEDPVTGSAHAVAADYWQQRQPARRRRCGLQASASGGRVFSHIGGDWVSIGGDVEILAAGGESPHD